MHPRISISRKYVDRGRLTNKQIEKFNTRWEFVKVEEKNYKFWNVLNLRGWSNRKTNRKVCIKHKRNNLRHTLYISFLFQLYLSFLFSIDKFWGEISIEICFVFGIKNTVLLFQIALFKKMRAKNGIKI